MLALTAAGLLLSAAACSLMIAERFSIAFILVLPAILLDELDGYLARRFAATSDLGAWLDSTADALTFLIFPLAYWYRTMRPAFVVMAIVFAAGAYRLVRHAVRGYEVRGHGLAFTGVPCSAIHVLLALSLTLPVPAAALQGLLVLLSIAMISRVTIRKPPITYSILGLVLYLTVVLWRSAIGF